MITVSLGLLVNPSFQASYQKLLDQTTLPIGTAFKLRRLTKQIREHIQNYEEQQSALIHKAAERNEDGSFKTQHSEQHNQDLIVLSPEKTEWYTKKINALAQTPVEIINITLADLGEKCLLSPNDIITLEFITEE